jgi:hypothetical protein
MKDGTSKWDVCANLLKRIIVAFILYIYIYIYNADSSVDLFDVGILMQFGRSGFAYSAEK